MREGPNGEGYVAYTQIKDAVASGEIDPDEDDYVSEVYLVHECKQAKQLKKQLRNNLMIESHERKRLITVAKIFGEPYSKELFCMMRKHYSKHGYARGFYESTGFEIDASLKSTADNIVDIYASSALISMLDEEKARSFIEADIALGNKLLE